MKNHISFSVLLLTTVLLIGTFAAIPWFNANAAQDSNADFVTIEGVAGNDYYDSRQYSYDVNQWAHDYEQIPWYPIVDPANVWFTAAKSIRLGLTEFGEFATPANTGIAYGADNDEWSDTESWASTSINPALYIQGWVFYMNYTRAGTMRCIEGYAIYSDLQTAQAGRKVWSWMGDRASNAAGAQLTAGYLTTEGIQMLYDSARLAVGRTTVTIHDSVYDEDVAKVTFTVTVNKDTKYAIIYKDVKLLIDPKVLDLINDFAFSERYEIDLARNINPSNQAYIHYFHNYNDTVYQHPLVGDTKFDVVQAFNPGRDYIYFAGYWPNTTEYAVYSPLVPDLPSGLTRVLPYGTEIADIPSPIDEPNTPWVIAQWRYNHTDYPKMLNFLAKDSQREIRFVEVAGMTDYNNYPMAQADAIPQDAVVNPLGIYPYRFGAEDINATDPENNVDTEVRYLLNNVFTPIDDLHEVFEEPFMWLGLGQSAATTDSAGGAVMSDFTQWPQMETLGLFDKNDTAFPAMAPVITMKGTIPFGLDNDGNFAPNYLETFSNAGKGTGSNSTLFGRTALNGFVFNYYDGIRGVPQPIAGGFSQLPGYWYPSKNPLTERWSTDGTTFTPAPYVTANPNGIITLGGMKANGLTRYFNDIYFAIAREGTSNYALINNGVVTDTAPTSQSSLPTLDFFPISTWASSKSTFDYKEGYAVIALARDINGTRGLAVYGWDGRDTYWAAAWASQYCGTFGYWLPQGTVALVLHITYSDANHEPTQFNVVKALGTITEFGTNAFATNYGIYDQTTIPWNADFANYAKKIPSLPVMATLSEWWYEKLPTTSTAKVDFDP